MRTSRVVHLAVVVTGLALCICGIALSSNMGFKFTPNIAPSQTFNLGLPWFNNYPYAKKLMDDINASPGSLALSVSKFNSNSTLLSWFHGAPPQNNFPLVEGSAYIVKAGSLGVSTYTIAGSHDPGFAFNFTANQAYNVAPPYHQTFLRVNALYNDMALKLGAGKIARISKFNANQTLTSWFSGAPATNNFALDLGMGVIVYPAQTASGYVWPHY